MDINIVKSFWVPSAGNVEFNSICFGGKAVNAFQSGGFWSIHTDADLRNLTDEELDEVVKKGIELGQSS